MTRQVDLGAVGIGESKSRSGFPVVDCQRRLTGHVGRPGDTRDCQKQATRLPMRERPNQDFIGCPPKNSAPCQDVRVRRFQDCQLVFEKT